MQTALADFIKDTPQGKEADSILRSCVHCGFCTATCPTYQLLGDELDGPRGRIYQIKQVLEGALATSQVMTHLDRCLTCRSCETTCPSGVEYGRLLDIGREIVEKTVKRPWWQRFQRQLLVEVLPHPNRLRPLLKLAQIPAFFLPKKISDKIPVVVKAVPWENKSQSRKMLLLDACVQSVSAPGINESLAKIFQVLGIQAISADEAGCCGALPMHLSKLEKAKQMAKNNIDAWWPEIEAGVEAIVISASGCGVHIKEYDHLLMDDELYASKAKQISKLCKDPVEILSSEDMKQFSIKDRTQKKISFHAPCTLQHGLKLPGKVESILTLLGYQLTTVKNTHLCCGSAGTYSVFQPEISNQLRDNKVEELIREEPEIIATANIGCLMHLQLGTKTQVMHWLNLVSQNMIEGK